MTAADTATDPSRPPVRKWTWAHLAALLMANVALSIGPFLVRLADTGPVSAAFWRLTIALPILTLLAIRAPAPQRRVGNWHTLVLILGGGLFFGLDLAVWHIGIAFTKLGNASLFGNAGSLILMIWGLIAARRAPHLLELAAIASALIGAALLMGGSLEISHRNFVGDLFCLLAGLFYAFYILMLNAARSRMGQFPVLATSMLASAPTVLAIALLRGEAIVPHDWTPLVTLAFTSQILGQGLLIYSLRHFPPLVIGVALLTQPAIASVIGWLAFGEMLRPFDVLGMVLLASALVMARAGDRPAPPPEASRP